MCEEGDGFCIVLYCMYVVVEFIFELLFNLICYCFVRMVFGDEFIVFVVWCVFLWVLWECFCCGGVVFFLGYGVNMCGDWSSIWLLVVWMCCWSEVLICGVYGVFVWWWLFGCWMEWLYFVVLSVFIFVLVCD